MLNVVSLIFHVLFMFEEILPAADALVSFAAKVTYCMADF